MAKDSDVQSLMTREQRFRAEKWDRMFVSRALIKSKAFWDLKTATSCRVFFIFLSKCRVEKVRTTPGSRDREYAITNNGEIRFSYIEAEEKYGISDGKFTRAIDDLVRVGVIDIAKTGLGLKKDVTLYAISDRWEKYATDEFVVKKRPKRKQQFGFTNKNRHGRNCKRPE